MYARRLYRKTPPGYSGVLFSPVKTLPDAEEDRIFPEDATLASSQRELHQTDTRRMAPPGREFLGYLLVPLYRFEGVTFIPAEREERPATRGETAETVAASSGEAREKTALSDELILAGALLLLLGAGLDTESVLVLIAVLALLT